MNHPADHTDEPRAAFDPAALVGACVLPGLGHVLSGERRRGILIAVGILGMFFGGIFVGGIDVVDKREDLVWFVGEALVGPVAFGIDAVHQHRFKVRDPSQETPDNPEGLRSAYPNEGRDPETGRPVPGGRPPNKKSIGKMNELGTLFCTIAGMINLIAIIDAGWPSPRRRSPAVNGGA